jgi:DNA-binding GntR family transcriptional regulator
MTLAQSKSLKEIQKMAAKRLSNRDHEGFFESNDEFHEAIFVGSKNNFLQQESCSLGNRVNSYRRYIAY